MSDYKNFRIAKLLKRRIRIIAPCLVKDKERAYILQILLLKREAIINVKVVERLGSVTVEFDQQQLPGSNLLHLLDAVLGNIGSKSKSKLQVIGRKRQENSSPLQHYHFAIEGMNCSSCALYLEMVLKRDPDITTAHVNFINETASVSGTIKQKEIFDIIVHHGFRAFALDSISERKLLLQYEQQRLQKSKRRLIVTAIFGLPVHIMALAARRSIKAKWLQAGLTTIVIAYGAKEIFKKAFVLMQHRTVAMDSLIAIGISSAYSYSLISLLRKDRHLFFESASGIILFVLLGRYLEEIAKARVIKQVHELVNMQPQEATLLQGGEEKSINVTDIRVDDILLVRPGERVPVDGKVIKGLSAVDESMVTGIARPCIKEKGQQVYDGSMNGSGILHIQASATGNDSVLSGLIQLVENAQNNGLPIQKTVDQISGIFIPVILLTSGGTLLAWRIAGKSFVHALSNALSVLLIACPCSLGLATPAATTVSTGKAARQGVYLRNCDTLETLAHIDHIVFDKTGTLTGNEASLNNLFNISSDDDRHLLQLAASAEFNSEHIIAKAIVRHARSLSLSLSETSHFVSVPDQGIRCRVNQHKVLLGNSQWMKKNDIDISSLQATAKKSECQGKITVFMALNEQAVALFTIVEDLRNEVVKAVQELHQMEITTHLVSGDTYAVSQHIADQVGIQNVTAQAGPAHKMRIIQELQMHGGRVAMIGDGVNDAPAISVADVGLAVRKGSDITLETADIILLNNDIGKVAESIELSRETMKVIRQNLFWAFFYNAFAIPVAVLGKLNPMIATLAMSVSSLSVIENSLRLNHKRKSSRVKLRKDDV